MKIFGSISELVDLAFRLAGGKQVKLRAATQTTSGNLVTVNVPDVAATGDTQSMVLNAATQTLSNKTLSSPTVSGGTINNSIIGGSTPAAGTFTDIVGSTLDINTSAELQTLTIPSFSTAGILHNNSSGAVSSSLIVNADITNSTITLAKLASIGDGKIVIGANTTGDPTARTMSGDVTIDNLGVTTIGASKVLNSMLAGNITRTKLATGNAYRIVSNDSAGAITQNESLAVEKALVSTPTADLASKGPVTTSSTTAAQIALLDDLDALKGKVQAQIDGKQAADATLSTIAALAPTTDQYIYFTGADTATTGTITSFGRDLIDDANAATARSTLGLGSMATQAASSVAITGGTVRGAALDRLAVESDNAAIASGTLVPSKGLMIITTGDNTLNTLNPSVGFNLVNGAVLTVINNEGADVTVTNAGNIQTGTGSDFTLKQGAASNFIYSTTLSKWVLSGGAGSSSATVAGFVNYITNADAQSDTTGWATYADAAGAAPVDGTGGTANVVWDKNTSSPLRGNADFSFVKDAANRQGQGVAFAFTIATTDRSKKCQISFDYDTSAANYAAGDMRVYVYDVTNATLITPQTVAIPKGTNTFQTTFDTTTSTSYRLILHVATTNATAYTVNFDNFVVNAGQVVQGAAISEWQDFTPSTSQGFGTITVTTARYRRVGSSMEVVARFDTGATTGDQARFGLPSGFTVSVAANVHVGDWQQGSAAANTRKRGRLLATNGVGYVLFSSDDYTTATGPFSSLTGSSVSGSSNAVSVQFTVPIAEWAGNGTVNLGAGAQVEYVADDGTNDVFGPNGAAIPSIVLGTGVTTRDFVFQYPWQQEDDLQVEIQLSGATNWIPAHLAYPSVRSSANDFYGIFAQWVSATVFRVQFGNRGIDASAGFGSNGNAWTNISRWRVRKAKASAPVGFGLVNSTDSGLLRAYNNMTLIRLHTANGFGSTNTKIRRFSTTVTNTGTGITYADSAANGASFTCTEAGIYTFTYSDSSSSTDTIGLSLNSSQLTTDLVSITAADRLVAASTAFANAITSVTVTIRLAVNDVVRPHSGGTAAGALSACTTFTVQRIA